MEFVSTLDLCDEWSSSDDDDDQEPASIKSAVVERIDDVGQTRESASNDATPPLPADISPVAPSTQNQPQFKTTMTQTEQNGHTSPNRAATTNWEMAATSSKNKCTESKLPIYIPPRPSESEEVIFGQEIRSGINFKKFSAIPVKISGKNVPPPQEDFAGSGLSPLLLDNIHKSGYTVPTPIQKYGIGAVRARRDVMACAQTGSGKTAAYLLGMLQRLLGADDNDDNDVAHQRQSQAAECGRPHAIIITPTRELALQIFDETRKFARGTFVRSCVIYGGTSTNYQLKVFRMGCHILVGTPGRILDFLENGYLDLSHIRFAVLDEADRMLDMGFLPDIQRLFEHPTMVPTGTRQTILFSATFPTDIQELAGRMLHNYVFIAVGIVGGACSDVVQTVRCVGHREKRHRLLDLLAEDERIGGLEDRDDGGGGTMVFVSTRRLADFLATYLSEEGVTATSIHGDRYQQQREQALSDFRSQRMRVLICTSVAARGLNIKNVQHVINYDMPNSIDDYVHRIGRTGRIGNKGRATSFFDPDVDAVLAGDLVRILEQAAQDVPAFLLKLSRCGPTVRTDNTRNEFGALDMRRRGDRNRDPVSHEPTVQW